jgi:hypothetical protein
MMKRFINVVGLVLIASATAADVPPLVRTLMESAAELSDVPFAEVVKAATGRQVLALHSTNAVDAELVSKIGRAMDEVLRQMNTPENPAQQQRRINEVSALFEAAMKVALNAVAGFECDYPSLASGARQRSGYPDLRLVDKKSGRVVYLDPKLFERGSRASSLRTFYYEPKRETNKISDDAHHLIVGFEHDGKADGAWKFLSWELVDLSGLRVKLKAEFQASNRELYQPEAVVGRSTNAIPKQPHQ